MIAVGTRCVVERRSWYSHRVDHRWEAPIAKVTAKRAYFANGDWFALDDPTREVRPRYMSNRTNVVELRPAPRPNEGGGAKGDQRT